jgi:Cysteine-rich CPXCG
MQGMEWIDDDVEDEDEASPEEGQLFQCPYCWEMVDPALESDLEGELVWDCEVCCRPWLIRIDVGIDGEKTVTVDRAQE